MRLREVRIIEVEAQEPITRDRILGFGIERVYDGRRLFIKRQHQPWRLVCFKSRRKLRMFLRKFRRKKANVIFEDGYDWSSYFWALDIAEVTIAERTAAVHFALQQY